MLPHCHTNIDRTFICTTYQSYPITWGNIDDSSGQKNIKDRKNKAWKAGYCTAKTSSVTDIIILTCMVCHIGPRIYYKKSENLSMLPRLTGS